MWDGLVGVRSVGERERDGLVGARETGRHAQERPASGSKGPAGGKGKGERERTSRVREPACMGWTGGHERCGRGAGEREGGTSGQQRDWYVEITLG